MNSTELRSLQFSVKLWREMAEPRKVSTDAYERGIGYGLEIAADALEAKIANVVTA